MKLLPGDLIIDRRQEWKYACILWVVIEVTDVIRLAMISREYGYKIITWPEPKVNYENLLEVTDIIRDGELILKKVR